MGLVGRKVRLWKMLTRRQCHSSNFGQSSHPDKNGYKNYVLPKKDIPFIQPIYPVIPLFWWGHERVAGQSWGRSLKGRWAGLWVLTPPSDTKVDPRYRRAVDAAVMIVKHERGTKEVAKGLEIRPSTDFCCKAKSSTTQKEIDWWLKDAIFRVGGWVSFALRTRGPWLSSGQFSAGICQSSLRGSELMIRKAPQLDRATLTRFLLWIRDQSELLTFWYFLNIFRL